MFCLTPTQLAEKIVDDLDYMGLICAWAYKSEIGAKFEVGNQSTTFAYVNVDRVGSVHIRMTSHFRSKKTDIKYRGEQEAMSAEVCSRLVRLVAANRKS